MAASMRYPFRSFADLFDAEVEQERRRQLRCNSLDSTATSSSSSSSTASSSREPSLVRWGTASTASTSVSTTPTSILRHPASYPYAADEDEDEDEDDASRPPALTAEDSIAQASQSAASRLRKLLGRRIAAAAAAAEGAPSLSVHFVEPAAGGSRKSGSAQPRRGSTPVFDDEADDDGLSLRRVAARGR